MSGNWVSLTRLLVKYLVLTIIVSIMVEVVYRVIYSLLPDKLKKKKKQEHSREQEKARVLNSDIVIWAEKVCLDFDRGVNELSSLKEFVIRKIKRRKKKGKFRALNDISFEIHKGDVVGVIGTNGAGKSTLLKVISGAYTPTSGTMYADRSKVQILTLGTGFDGELTGRENVYLNGAIIGYERSFIKEHYDEIVEFAELEGFMDEKMKNYSSGMVSRLAFSIATVGNVAEILILDEVLSVGDRLFSQKSLKRIQEMIHSGSTVIMVSHSIAAIKKNCNKVLWIEKGRMIAYGDTEEICDLYENYDGNELPESVIIGSKKDA